MTSMASARRAARMGAPMDEYEVRETRRYRGTSKHEESWVQNKAEAFVEVIRVHPALTIGLVTLAVAVVMLMGPFRDYYVARRTNDDLTAYLTAMEEQNGELDSAIKRLQTRDGVEDQARARGLVYPNEMSVLVEGLEESNPALPEVEFEFVYERPWYVEMTDRIFGYEFGIWQ